MLYNGATLHTVDNLGLRDTNNINLLRNGGIVGPKFEYESRNLTNSLLNYLVNLIYAANFKKGTKPHEFNHLKELMPYSEQYFLGISPEDIAEIKRLENELKTLPRSNHPKLTKARNDIHDEIKRLKHKKVK